MITISFMSEEERKNLEEEIKKLNKQLCEQGHEPLFYYRVELLKELTEARLELGKAANKSIPKLDDTGKLKFYKANFMLTEKTAHEKQLRPT